MNNLNHKWEIIDGKLNFTFTFESYIDGLEFAYKVGEAAEEVNHHPEIKISYKKVGIELFTHDEEKITEKDYNLAKKIEEIYGQH